MRSKRTDFRVKALDKEQFTEYFNYSDTALSEIGARIIDVESSPGYPCRVSLADAEIGERVLAINFVHHDVKSPYRSSGPVFVRQGAETASLDTNEIPEMLLKRMLSVRVYNANHIMINAQVINGESPEEILHGMFSDEQAEYIHIHNARPGCFNCSVLRAV